MYAHKYAHTRVSTHERTSGYTRQDIGVYIWSTATNSTAAYVRHDSLIRDLTHSCVIRLIYAWLWEYYGMNWANSHELDSDWCKTRRIHTWHDSILCDISGYYGIHLGNGHELIHLVNGHELDSDWRDCDLRDSDSETRVRHASLICDIHMLNCSFMRDISGYYGMNLVNGHELDNDFGFSSGGPSRIWLEVCMSVCIYTQVHTRTHAHKHT